MTCFAEHFVGERSEDAVGFSVSAADQPVHAPEPLPSQRRQESGRAP